MRSCRWWKAHLTTPLLGLCKACAIRSAQPTRPRSVVEPMAATALRRYTASMALIPHRQQRRRGLPTCIATSMLRTAPSRFYSMLSSAKALLGRAVNYIEKYITTARHMFPFFEAPIRYTLSDFASSFDMMGVFPVTLTSWILDFIQGNNLGDDGAYGLGKHKEIQAQCTYYYIQCIAINS